MAIKKPFTAYNGTQCDYHAVASFEHNQGDTGVIIVGSYRELLDAKLRRGEVMTRRIPFSGVSRSENIRHDLYQILVQHPDFADGEHV